MKYIVEFFGTFFLVLTIGMTVIDPGGAGAMAPLAIGLVLMVMVYAGGHISGAHYNPAVTISVVLRGKCAAGDAAPYIIAQILAAALASFAVLFLKQGETITAMSIDPMPALLAECLFTLALAYVVLNVATAKANANNSFYGLAIGFTVLAGAYSVGSISGGAFNPAVAVGLGIMGLVKWADLWVHLVGNIAGAVAAAIAFRAITGEKN